MPERIRVERVSKTYGRGNLALDDVSLDVAPGTFLALLGPSGSGKTTLLRCLAGIERLSSGELTIGETVVAGAGVHVPPERRDLSMVFQDFALWPHLVARDNVAFALRRRGLGRAERRAEAADMLHRVGLGALAERYPSELSGGEQQRVALARALVARTGIVLCDEPLSNLDADLRDRVRVEIASLVRSTGATTVYITHDQAEAFAVADRVAVLEAGRLVQDGAPEEIYTDPATAFVARFTGLAIELSVRVCASLPDGRVEVEPTETAFRGPIAARWTSPARPATSGLLAIRPTGVQLCDAGSDDCQVAGVVADVAFRDRGYEHAIDLAGRLRVSGVLSPVRADRGEPVGLRFDPAGCLFFSG